MNEAEIKYIASEFFPGAPVACMRCDGGYLHETYLVSFGNQAIIIQKIGSVFRDKAEELVKNYEVLFNYFNKSNLSGPNEIAIPAPLGDKNGSHLYYSKVGDAYRAFEYIKDSNCHNSPNKKYEAIARAFGHYVCVFSDLDESSLNELIAEFHNLELRFKAFINAIKHPRVIVDEVAKDTIRELENLSSIVDEYRNLVKLLKPRIVHNDAKASNILFKKHQDSAMAFIIDLDTTFVGYVPVDFGDMVRSCAISIKEGETQACGEIVNFEVFAALKNGYFSSLGAQMSKEEKNALVFGAIWMTYETSIRFMTDYLEGSHYFKIEKPTDNLNRAISQLIATKGLISHRAALEDIVMKDEYA